MEQLEIIETLLEHERNKAAGNVTYRDFGEFIDEFFSEIDNILSPQE